MTKNNRLEKIFSNLKAYYDELEEARDKAIKLSRDIIRLSGRLVNMIVRGKIEEAEGILKELRTKASQFRELLRPYPPLYTSGFYNNTMSEYSEALILYNIISGRVIPEPEELGVSPTAFLQGLGDVVGELRRIILEKLKNNLLDECWDLISLMEEIQIRLSEMDYPEPLVPGVRHKADSARRLVDSTKAFLIDLSEREKLTNLLRELGEERE